jgi:hypothetical protein
MMRVATKFLHVDVWTNLTIKRVLKLLDGLGVGDVPGAPPVDSVRAELRDLLARRYAEGVGRMNYAAWQEAKRKTAAADKRKKHAKPSRHRARLG